MQETIDVDKDGNPLTFADILAEDDTIVEELDLKLRSAQARTLMQSVLTEREREILIMRYGLGSAPPATQNACAQSLGISRSYVSRLEKSALQKLREHMNP